ncbi:MAG: ORF6N domain-containing protein [Bacteroidales bacterium]|nr:ORF6N domain-containing protein [Bacteroidales bacterium]
MESLNKYQETESKVIVLRGIPVIIDRDVADLYGVTTKAVNQAVKNNPDKFKDYLITLESREKWELVKNFDRFQPLKHSVSMPTAFTEKGLYMLATVLKSPIATEVTRAIIETFARLREIFSCGQEYVKKMDFDELKDKVGKLTHELNEALEDSNDINEDTRMRLELLEEAVAELKAFKGVPRKPIGYLP